MTTALQQFFKELAYHPHLKLNVCWGEKQCNNKLNRIDRSTFANYETMKRARTQQ